MFLKQHKKEILTEEEQEYIIKIKTQNDIDRSKKELREFFNITRN